MLLVTKCQTLFEATTCTLVFQDLMQHTTLRFVFMPPWSPQICDSFSVFPYFVIFFRPQSLALKNKNKKQSPNVCSPLCVSQC